MILYSGLGLMERDIINIRSSDAIALVGVDQPRGSSSLAAPQSSNRGPSRRCRRSPESSETPTS